MLPPFMVFRLEPFAGLTMRPCDAVMGAAARFASAYLDGTIICYCCVSLKLLDFAFFFPLPTTLVLVLALLRPCPVLPEITLYYG